MDDEACSSRMIVPIYQAAWRHIPEAHNLLITVDLEEEGYEGVVLIHFFPRGDSCRHGNEPSYSKDGKG
jgi:hypothetical protein